MRTNILDLCEEYIYQVWRMEDLKDGGAPTLYGLEQHRNDVIMEELHKTGEERFKNDSNLYLPQKWYFLINPQTILFRRSHVKKLKEG